MDMVYSIVAIEGPNAIYLDLKGYIADSSSSQDPQMNIRSRSWIENEEASLLVQNDDFPEG